ncbi:MAG: ABC transporter substrate-binding protein [Acidimicrobiia bacterium]
MSSGLRSGRRGALGVLLVAGLLIAACGDDDDSSSPTDTAGGGTAGDSVADSGADSSEEGGGGSDAPLLIARGMDVNSLDPSRAYCDTCQIYMTAVYETLIGLDEDNTTLVPRLATEWASNADQTQFTFQLDPAAKFADGSAVTSADVQFSWERLQKLEGSASYLVSGIESIETPDPQTVVVNMTSSNSAFLAQVNGPYLGIVNSKLAQENGATTDPTTDAAEQWFLGNSAGSGPFTLASYAEGNELRLARNDSYWRDPAAFPEVVIKETPQAVTQRQQLEQGAVDIAMQISNDVATDMSGGDVTVERAPSFNFVYLALSPGAAGGEELTPEVLQAIRLALDYTGIVDVTVGGSGRPQPSPIPNGFLGTDGLATPEQDVEAAKALLADAGVTSLDLDATFPSLNVYGVDFATVMQKVQSDLKEVNINLELNPVEIAVWADKITTDGIPVTALYFAPDHTDPSQYVQYFGLLEGSQWQTWTRQPPNATELDLLGQALAEQDLAKRGELYQQLANAMIEDGVIIPLVNPDLFLAARSDITGMHYSACCNLDLYRLGRG